MPGTWPEARAAIASRLNGTKIPATYEFSYSTEADGPFEVGETLTFQSGGTGTLTALDDDGTTGTMAVRMALSAAAPANGNTISGGTSSATAVVASAPSGTAEETLTAFGLAHGRQGLSVFPYAQILPVSVVVNRYPSWREYVIEVVARVFLSGPDETSVYHLHRRYDEWWQTLAARWDGFAALGGDADISVEQAFSGLLEFTDIERGWGFDMALPNIRVSEAVTFTA